MKFFDANGILQKARRYVSGSAGVQQDDISTPDKLQHVIRDIQRRVAGVESRTPPEGLEFELNVGQAGTITQVPHNVGGPVRWYVTSWTQTGGVTVPVLGHSLVEDSGSTSNMLLLRSYVAGRAIVRVEPAFAGLSYGQTVPWAPPIPTPPTSYVLSNLNVFTTTNTTLTDTPYSFTGQAGETWRIDYNGITQAAANGMQYAIKAPVGSTIEWWITTLSLTTSGLAEQRLTSVNTASATFHTTALGVTGIDRVHGVVTLASTGTVALQISAAASSSASIFSRTSFTANKVTPV